MGLLMQDEHMLDASSNQALRLKSAALFPFVGIDPCRCLISLTCRRGCHFFYCQAYLFVKCECLYIAMLELAAMRAAPVGAISSARCMSHYIPLNALRTCLLPVSFATLLRITCVTLTRGPTCKLDVTEFPPDKPNGMLASRKGLRHVQTYREKKGGLPPKRQPGTTTTGLSQPVMPLETSKTLTSTHCPSPIDTTLSSTSSLPNADKHETLTPTQDGSRNWH